MDNPEKLATWVHKPNNHKTKTLHNMCWATLYANKHK